MRSIYSSPSRPYRKQSIAKIEALEFQKRGDGATKKESTNSVNSLSIIGVDKLFKKDYPKLGKVIWLVILVAVTALCLRQQVKCILTYLQFPTVICTGMDRTFHIKYPVVYLCPSILRNYLSTSLMIEYAKCFEKTRHCLRVGQNVELFAEEIRCFETEPCFQDPQIKYLLTGSKTNSTDRLWSEIYSINKKNIKVYQACNHENRQNCHSDGKIIPVNITEINSIWGRCLAISTDKVMSFLGSLTFIRIVYENPIFKEGQQLTDDEISGLLMYFHNDRSDNLRHNLFLFAQEITQGFRTHIILRQQKSIVINKTHELCLTEDDYRQCLSNCLEIEMMKKHPYCRMPYTSLTHFDAICPNDESIYKTLEADYTIYSDLNVSHCYCHKPCDEMIYLTTTDVVDRLTNFSKIIVKLYFNDNTHVVGDEQYIYSFDNLLSDFGGNLGFFLGFCCLTAIEMMEFITKMGTHLGKKVYKNLRSHQVTANES